MSTGTPPKPTIMDLTKEELAQAVKPAFRAKQIFGWIYRSYADRFDDMANLPKALRDQLNARFILNPVITSYSIHYTKLYDR